ncbi:MAG: hypothetical protein MJE77_27335 [Proteobacteria bacterium]|nr:hypothetical protein [Pseudomonadota bacterium]
MNYREETTWVLRFEVGASFDDDYDGELDGYAWRDQFYRDVQPRVVAAVFRELEKLPGWKVRPGNRGMSSRDEILIHLELREKVEGST